MSVTRRNHYVPRWYQERFFVDGHNTIAYLDLEPPQKTLPDGRTVTERAYFDAPTSRAFWKQDLYSTFFGASVNDEIERKLFGDIDRRGVHAITAFSGNDESAWHQNFETLFEYLDIQKLRTPKGLDWLKTQYPGLSQNELMFEMQGVQFMNCTIWSEGVREIVSAEESEVKFIISDHPVTVYNHALSPSSKSCAYPNDPGIALKASQTLFPLSPDFCLILTNLEYAKDPSVVPTKKRTFARNYGHSMVSTIEFIRSRKLSAAQVSEVNFIVKARAQRFIGGGRKEWLFPEKFVDASWESLRTTLLPPEDELHRFGGELYASYESGDVYYQDAFGRTEKEREFLKKSPPAAPKAKEACGCGSGLRYRDCCLTKPASLRPSWEEMSIRERNLMLLNGIVNVLDLENKDWATIRRELTDEQIFKVYRLYEGLWPLSTNLLSLLPKPDGAPRAVYTGSIHPNNIDVFVLGAAPYFGELIVQTPFLHAGTVNKDFSPIENPHKYRHEFLKTVVLFLKVIPFVDMGFINLIPDPCDFDLHLRDQMMGMAQSRNRGAKIDIDEEPGVQKLAEEDFKRSIQAMPREALKAKIASFLPPDDNVSVDDVMQYMEADMEQDPLADLQQDAYEKRDGGQIQTMKLAPNFEIAMYLAQATGSYIITDSVYRWREIQRAANRRFAGMPHLLPALADSIQSSSFAFAWRIEDVFELMADRSFSGHRSLMRDTFKYLSRVELRGTKANYETSLAARFSKVHKSAQTIVQKSRMPENAGKLTGFFPAGGIQDNTVNRLLLMSSSEHHLPAVPMAFFMETEEASVHSAPTAV